MRGLHRLLGHVIGSIQTLEEGLTLNRILSEAIAAHPALTELHVSVGSVPGRSRADRSLIRIRQQVLDRVETFRNPSAPLLDLLRTYPFTNDGRGLSAPFYLNALNTESPAQQRQLADELIELFCSASIEDRLFALESLVRLHVNLKSEAERAAFHRLTAVLFGDERMIDYCLTTLEGHNILPTLLYGPTLAAVVTSGIRHWLRRPNTVLLQDIPYLLELIAHYKRYCPDEAIKIYARLEDQLQRELEALRCAAPEPQVEPTQPPTKERLTQTEQDNRALTPEQWDHLFPASGSQGMFGQWKKFFDFEQGKDWEDLAWHTTCLGEAEDLAITLLPMTAAQRQYLARLAQGREIPDDRARQKLTLDRFQFFDRGDVLVVRIWTENGRYHDVRLNADLDLEDCWLTGSHGNCVDSTFFQPYLRALVLRAIQAALAEMPEPAVADSTSSGIDKLPAIPELNEVRERWWAGQVLTKPDQIARFFNEPGLVPFPIFVRQALRQIEARRLSTLGRLHSPLHGRSLPSDGRTVWVEGGQWLNRSDWTTQTGLVKVVLQSELTNGSEPYLATVALHYRETVIQAVLERDGLLRLAADGIDITKRQVLEAVVLRCLEQELVALIEPPRAKAHSEHSDQKLVVNDAVSGARTDIPQHWLCEVSDDERRLSDRELTGTPRSFNDEYEIIGYFIVPTCRVWCGWYRDVNGVVRA